MARKPCACPAILKAEKALGRRLPIAGSEFDSLLFGNANNVKRAVNLSLLTDCHYSLKLISLRTAEEP